MSDLEQLYQQVILDHARARTGSGDLPEQYDGKSHQVNPTCGDEVTLAVSVDDKGIIDQIHWEGDGCSISQASLSVMSEMLPGMAVDDREATLEAFMKLMRSRGHDELSEEELDLLGDANAFTGVAKFPARVKCALLGWMALKDALAQAQNSGTDTEELPEGENK
ncbi:SUF system NifU family Fe-S cluster assembly protein [Boudabousia liubingyangii]|uniref:SUF system NifU family Fe-S cluster assembly protein n=1 Tax=Boudabousia liubingyangii TaxID=1921764 RepID=A0A1Q5PNH7_9ACTO|nr:SUF system NifU family Fe-S cluster assembly protein [Boudabousia liubingyangii]OKL47586.1 SUF system NifU family Fe-S cluster assembly protein [Boudabousia liubingyangii]OKL49010.1 SUF system NifU family Fe-S cluster assembly protein [Boudabousia liubingyangii]